MKNSFILVHSKSNGNHSEHLSLGKLVKSAKAKDRSSKEGGRVITSSSGPIGSHEGSGKKDRISVCKMAAMSMSKERSQDRKDPGQSEVKYCSNPTVMFMLCFLK